MIARPCTGIVALALVGLCPPARAQPPAPARAVRVQGVSFAVLRGTSTGSMAFYSAHAVGPGLAMVGVTATPQSGHRAVIAGVGSQVRLGASAGLTIIVAGAQATDGRSARLYLLPSITVSRLSMSATATAYHPLGGTSRREAALNPLTVTVRATPALSAGLAFALHAAQGRPPRTGLGLALQIRNAVGALSVQFLPIGLEHPEIRGSFRAAL